MPSTVLSALQTSNLFSQPYVVDTTKFCLFSVEEKSF